MSGKKSAEKSSGGGGIKSFFASKATPQSKVNEVSPQSVASENCIDLSKEEKTGKKQANPKTPEPNLFFMSKSQRQQALAAQRDAKEKEIQRQREAEELLIAQQREARIQEEIIRSRKETNLLLLGKSGGKGEASGSKSHNPFFLARAPAPVKTSQNGSMTSCSNLVAEVVDLPEVHFPSTQNVGLEGSLGALLQQIQSYNNDFRKRPALNATPDTDALAVSQMCVPDWVKTAFSDLTAQEYSASFALPRGRGGEHSANRVATGQARMYPLAQASLNLRALWLLWVQRTLTEDKASASANSSFVSSATRALNVPMKVSPSSLTLPESAEKDSCDAVSAVDRSPTAILTRWLSDWAAKRARSTGNSSTNDLALTACNINNKNSRSKVNNSTPSLTRTSSRSQASSAGSNIGGKGRASRNNSVKKGSDVLKRRRGGVVRDESDDENEDDDVDAIEDSSAEEEDEEEEEQAGSDEGEDEWQSSAAEEEGSESEVEYGRSGRRRHSTTTLNSSRQLSSRGGIATDEEQLLNVMVLEGPSGSGKSAAVHETARLLGYKVIEVNASHLRNGASIKKLISEAAQSAHIMDNMSGNASVGNGGIGAAATEMNLILFDEVDIACDEEDAQLHHTIQNLAHISKCPILLTSEQPLPFFKALHAKYVKFTRPDVSTCCSGKSTVDHEGASDALQCLVRNIRALSGAALAKGNGSNSSSHAASYSDVTVLDEGIAKHGNTSKSSSSAALAAMFGSAKKPIIQLDATIGAADSGSALPLQTRSPLASFSPADLMRLQVLCGLSDGDLRAALSSVQLFPDHFLGATKPAAPTAATAVPSSGRTSPFVQSSAVVDLTSSPAAVKRSVSHSGLVDLTSPPEIEDVSRQEPGCSFGRFLSETLQLDFALFDSSLGVLDDLLKSAAPPNDDSHKVTLDAASSTETTVTIATGVSTSNSELYAPVVHDVQPRYGLVAGGFLMTITGAHFLQHSAGLLPTSDQDENAPHPAEVRVFLNGHVSCPCVLKSDTSIVAYIPAMRREGVYTVHVEVHVALAVPATHKVVVARSVSTGVGAAWIHLRQRYFPLMRYAHNSSQKLLVAPAQNRATVRGDTQSTDDLSPASASSSSDEGRAVNDNTDGGDGNRRVAKRLWSCTQDASEQADTPSTSEQGGASSSNNNNQRRKRRVISDDSDEASDNDSVAEKKKEKAAREKDSNLEEDEDDMSLAESDEDDAISDDAPNSSSAVKPAAAAASTADASMLQSLVEKVQSSLLATLNKVKDNGHSEPFLLPVDDRDVPGYSQEIARPMDLSTVTESLKEGLYSAPRSLVVNALTGELVCQNNFPDVVSFVEDVRLIWSNCVQFNDKDSPFTRSAYLVSCLFDSTLRDMLQSAFVSFPGAKVLSEDRNGAYICVRLEFNGENVFLVPRCTSFDRCMKLRKVLAPPRIRSLLAERQMSDISSGNGENGMVGNNNQNTVPHTAAVGLVSHNGSLLHPASATQPFLTAEEALAPERADATSADKSAVIAALNEAQAKRQLLLTKTPSKRNLVPGLQSIANVSLLTEGLEYENDECAPIVVLTLPTGTSSAAVHAASQADLSALSQLSARSEAFSVADRFTSVATSLAEYNCLQHEDEATDCAERCWTSSNTSVSAHEGSRSYAQIYNASRYYSMYGDCLRQGALQVMADNVRANVDALQQSLYSSKELPACRKKSGYAYLGSAYLEHNLRRTEHMRLLSTVANKYTSSTGNRAGSAWVCGLIVQHTLPSLCCVPRALTVDVFPLVGVMCRSEMNNNADEEYQQQRRLTEYSSEMSGLGRRSSRRGNSGEKEPELARKHKCFVEMKTILNNTDEKIIRQLAVAYDGCC